jgi:hypothetical protein
VVVEFAYKCPEFYAYQTAAVNIIKAYWAVEDKCEEAGIFLRDLRHAFDELRDAPEIVTIGLQYLCNQYIAPDPSGASLIVQIGISDILNRQFPKIQMLVEEMQEVCNEWNDKYIACQVAYSEYMEAFGSECISICFLLGSPLDINCSPCDLLESAGNNPCEFRPIGNYSE